MASPRRPLLSADQRSDVGRLAQKAAAHIDESSRNRAYAQGVYDVLDWLTGGEPSPLLEEVTR